MLERNAGATIYAEHEVIEADYTDASQEERSGSATSDTAGLGAHAVPSGSYTRHETDSRPAQTRTYRSQVTWRIPFVEHRQRLQAGRGAVVCDCDRNLARDGESRPGPDYAAMLSYDGQAWVCAAGRCDFYLPVGKTAEGRVAEMRGPLAAAIDAAVSVLSPRPATVQPAEARPVATPLLPQPPSVALDGRVPVPACALTDDDILHALTERCGFGVDRVGWERSVEFGRFLLKRLELPEWTRDVAVLAWKEWQS